MLHGQDTRDTDSMTGYESNVRTRQDTDPAVS